MFFQLVANYDKNITNVEFFNGLGKRILKVESPKKSINVSKLNRGIYFVKFTNNFGYIIKKVVIE
ncbi:T9SS type A sorting domain-containing protein [Hyunsoonleella sp. 2307UL5-6]|uniref:T9SS type A sorting domain-containing protein n=1 Tax=Hyunsoonleella sp. 2307UL5-6 TaxID=3384768 RepID=UPI0039BC55BD